MADLKRKGDLAELMIAADLVRQGWRVAFPYGEDSDFDLLVERGDRWERVQVKHVVASPESLVIRARSVSLSGGRVRATKRYTAATIDWLAAYEPAGRRCFYVPAAELGAGLNTITLRLAPARNGQRRRTRMAVDYEQLPRATLR